MASTHTRQQGFSIIEGLLAILIFSVGVLAMVGLQATSTKAITDVKFRIDASYLANEIIGQMWVDDHTTATLQNNYNTGGAKYLPWRTEVQSSLPNAATNPPTVSIDANNIATVTVFWTPPGSSVAHNFVAMAQIR